MKLDVEKPRDRTYYAEINHAPVRHKDHLANRYAGLARRWRGATARGRELAVWVRVAEYHYGDDVDDEKIRGFEVYASGEWGSFYAALSSNASSGAYTEIEVATARLVDQAAGDELVCVVRED